MMKIPTVEQERKIEELKSLGYTWDKQWSVSAAGVIMAKGKDFWFFDPDGGIQHNPEAYIHIKLSHIHAKKHN